MNHQNIELIKPSTQAWTRFAARIIDISIFSLLFGFIFALCAQFLFPALLVSFMNQPDVILNVEVLFLWIFVETALLFTWGKTPGKWLLQLTIKNTMGNKLTLKEAFTRSTFVFFRGMGLGLPIISLITWYISYLDLTTNGITKWDERGKLQMNYKPNGVIRISIAVLIVIIHLGGNIYIRIVNG